MMGIRIRKHLANSIGRWRTGSSKRRRCGKRCFTLIELLVVTAILGVIVAVILACLAGGIRVWDVARKFNTGETEVVMAFEEMERDLMNSFPYFGIYFCGNRGDVSFPGLVVAGGGALGNEAADRVLRRIGTVKYFYDESGHTLCRKAWVYPGPEPSFERSEKIVSDVAGVKFQYYLRFGGNEGGTWQDSWNDASNHPGRVRIELTIGGSGAQSTVTRTMCLALDPVWRDDGGKMEKSSR